MCDFISVVVRVDGKLAHVPSNSHSGAVAEAGWLENGGAVDSRFVEAEWNPSSGKFPGVDKVTRGTANEKQSKKIEEFYENAIKLFSNPGEHAERMCFGGGYFAAECFADIRFHAMHQDGCPKKIIAKLAVTSLYASGQEILSLHPSIAKLEGNFRIKAGCKIDAPALAEVSGSIAMSANSSLTAPALAEVSGSIDMRENSSLTAPALAEVSGYIDMSANSSLTAPALAEVSGYIDMRENSSLTAPALTKSGYIDMSANSSLTAPALTKSGYIAMRRGAKLDAPKLKRK